MHKLQLNRARIAFTLRPETPLLVKSGDKAGALVHPERPDAMFVRTRRNGVDTVYIPGSSLKGVVRSTAERILRTIAPELACDPLVQSGTCHREASELADKILNSRGSRDAHPLAPVHKKLCLACRLFGSQAMAARVSFADAYPTAPTEARANRTETRSGVAIDRRTGGPSSGKLFEMEIVTGGRFSVQVHLANFELWQLGLIGQVIDDIHDGFVRIGSSKSRGLGHMEVDFESLRIDQRATERPSPGPAGVGTIDPTLVDPYGLLERDTLGPAFPSTDVAFGQRYEMKGNEAAMYLRALGDATWPVLRAGRA